MSILDVYEWLTDGIGGAVLGSAGTVAKAGVALPGVKDYLAGCKDKLVAGRLLPGNHDLVRGVRTAHICALDHVARRHASALRSLPAHEVGADEHAFADTVRGFLDQRLAVLNQGSMDHDAVTAEDMAHVLSDLIHAATSEGFDACEREARARAEARALQEIEKDAGRLAPPLFARAFAGDGKAGWYDAFALFVTEKLKTEERFRSIFFATELVDIKRAVAALDGRIGQVVASLPDILSFRDAVVASLARIEAIALRIEAKIDQLTGSGVPERPLRAVLRKLDVADIAKEEIPGELEKAANELVALRAQLRTLSNDGPQFDAIRARALAAIDAGEFDRARTILGEGRNAAREQREQATRIEAEFLVEEARVAKLQRDYPATIEALQAALRLTPDAVWTWIELGDLQTTLGSIAKAKTAYEGALAAARRLNDERVVSVSLDKIGDMLAAEGDRAGALTSYREGLDIRRRLAARGPENTTWQRDVSVSLDKIGDMLAAEGDRAGALTSYREGLDIARRLAARDPENTTWQRDVSVSLNKIGDMLAAEGDRAAALTSYREGLEIARRLAARDPENAEWQRDVSVSLNKIGDMLAAEGDRAGALTSYREGLDIARRLAARDPENAGWQRDLIVSNVKMAEVDPGGGAGSYREALKIATALRDSGRTAPVDAWMVDELTKRLRAAEGE